MCALSYDGASLLGRSPSRFPHSTGQVSSRSSGGGWPRLPALSLVQLRLAAQALAGRAHTLPPPLDLMGAVVLTPEGWQGGRGVRAGCGVPDDPRGADTQVQTKHLVESGNKPGPCLGWRPRPGPALRPWSRGTHQGQTERTAGNLWMEAQIWSPGRPRPNPEWSIYRTLCWYLI